MNIATFTKSTPPHAAPEPVGKALTFASGNFALPKAPWQMSQSQFVGSTMSPDRESRAPADVPALRETMPSLHDHRHDPDAVRSLLGHGGNPNHDVSHLAGKAKRNEKIAVYRTTDHEDEILPGASVSPSKQFTLDHAASQGMPNAKLLTRDAYPHELLPQKPNSFIYAPANVAQHHAESVVDAVRQHKPVPVHVLADYPNMRSGSASPHLTFALHSKM